MPEPFERVLNAFEPELFERCAGLHIDRHFIHFIPCSPSPPVSLHLQGHQHPLEHAVHTKHPARESIWVVLDHFDAISIPSHAACSPAQLSAVTLKALNSLTPAPHGPPSFDITGADHMLQDIMDEVLAQGVWITHVPRLCRQELVKAQQSIHLAVTAALSRRECECMATVVCIRLSYSNPYCICPCVLNLLQ